MNKPRGTKHGDESTMSLIIVLAYCIIEEKKQKRDESVLKFV